MPTPGRDSDTEFSIFLARRARTYATRDGYRRYLNAERHNIVPFNDRLSREFAHRTEELANGLRADRKRQSLPERKAS